STTSSTSLHISRNCHCTLSRSLACPFLFFLFTDPATTDIYTLSLHDALPIWTSGTGPGPCRRRGSRWPRSSSPRGRRSRPTATSDRKSTRLNSSHSQISYGVFCLKKKTHVLFVGPRPRTIQFFPVFLSFSPSTIQPDSPALMALFCRLISSHPLLTCC